MKKTFATILVLVALISAMIVTQVIASPVQPSVDAKKTPGAQATENALRKLEKHNGNQVGEDALEIVKKNVMLKGTIAAVDETQMELTLKDDTIVTVLLSETSSVKIPKLNPKKNPVTETLVPSETVEPTEAPELTETPTTGFGGLAVGMRVHVKANLMSDGTYVAVSVSVIPGKPVKAYHVGIVYEYVPGVSITITTKKCEFTTYLLTAETKLLPAERMSQLVVGSLVTVISPRDVTFGPLTAAGIVIHPDKSLDGDSTEEPTSEPTGEPTEDLGCVLPTAEPTDAPTVEPI